MNVIDLRCLFKNNAFFCGVAFLCFAYVLHGFLFVPKQALTADEFVFARHIYEYTYHIPYRDFSPYKAVLGYYLLSVPMFFSHTLLEPIFYIKKEIVLINALCIALTCCWAGKIFDRRAILLTLLAITLNQVFIIYAADLRVDMLTSWLCLFAILAVIDQKIELGGVLLGFAFLISQKAIWYLIAVNSGFFCCNLFCQSPLYNWRTAFTLNFFVLFPIAVYIISWLFVTNPYTIFYNLFYEAYIQAGINYYSSIYSLCWQSVLMHGPVLFLLWPLTSLTLFIKDMYLDRSHQVFSFVCGSVALFLFIGYKQAFPYNFVFTFPAFFILYANFFSSLPALGRPTKLNFFELAVGIYFIYLFLIFVVIYGFHLPPIYYATLFIPISLYFVVFSSLDQQKKNKLRQVFFVLFFMLALVIPFIQTIRSGFIDGRYQQKMIYLTEQLLANGGDYIGGIPFLYNKDQPIDGMKNLITPAIDYLSKPTAELKLLLLPSLYLTSTSTKKVLADFEKAPVKVVINNYRISLLPPAIHAYIYNNYKHYYGSIYLYAPKILQTTNLFNIKFNGQYRVEGKAPITLDHKQFYPGQVISLQKGVHISKATQSYRLVLIPEPILMKLNPRYQKDEYLWMNKSIVA